MNERKNKKKVWFLFVDFVKSILRNYKANNYDNRNCKKTFKGLQRAR